LGNKFTVVQQQFSSGDAGTEPAVVFDRRVHAQAFPTDRQTVVVVVPALEFRKSRTMQIKTTTTNPTPSDIHERYRERRFGYPVGGGVRRAQLKNVMAVVVGCGRVGRPRAGRQRHVHDDA